MKFGIEEIKTKHHTRLVTGVVIILILVLLVSIGLGIWAAKSWHKYKQDQQSMSDNKDTIITEESNKNTISKSQWLKNVENIYNGKEGKRVFLTFDDGPSDTVTPHILDILKKYNIKATFFVLGNRVSNHKELIQREYNEGHYIANHGYSHRYDKIYSSSSKVLEEYNKTEAAIKKALGNKEYESNLFRFPGGSVGGSYDKVKKQAKKQLKKEGIAYLDWNALTNDANGAKSKKEIIKNLKTTIQNKDNVVVLMHDAADKKLTYQSLEEVIKYLKKQGYNFKNMYDLMQTEE